MTNRVRDRELRERSRRAELHLKRGMYALAREELEPLLQVPCEDPEELAGIRWQLALCCVALGQTEDADRILDEALRRADIAERSRSRLEAVRGFAALSRGEYARAEEICRRAAETLRGLGDHEGLTQALRWLATTHLRRGNLDDAFECAYCALAEARYAELPSEAAHAHGLLCVALIQRGQYDAALAHGREALQVASRLGHQSGMARHNLHLSIAARLSGDLDLAATHAMRSLASAEETDATNLVVSARLAASRALREAGRLDAARELAAGALEAASKSERGRDHVLVLEDLGDLDMASGNAQSALEKYREAMARAERLAPEGDLVAELAWRMGHAFLELDRSEEAGAWIERSLEVATKAGERKEYALALRMRGLLHATAGREADARRDLDESLARIEALHVPYEQAKTHLFAARALAECGAGDAATWNERRQHTAAARRLFDRLGSITGLRAAEEVEARIAAEETESASSASRVPGRRGVAVFDLDWPSASFRATLEECQKLGPTSLTLLLVGETGTGKSILAEAMHQMGRGEAGDFHAVNCAALPDHLQESELFGHRKGAFTGAEREHLGIFREAGAGTVFLDEIDKTSLTFQAKLLHVLDTREVRPVGSTHRVRIDARIVCATNRDLFAQVREGEFLSDLHHRLTSGILRIPPLRERVEDLRHLSALLLEEVGALERAPVPRLTEDAWAVLLDHDWPGNVRELKSLLHRAIVLNRGVEVLNGEAIRASAPPGSGLCASSGEDSDDLASRLERTEREEILRALEKARGVRRRAAEILGVSYRGLGKKMARLGIESEPAGRQSP